MAEERRNLYRILHVQPEAPLEVIRASYRTLMSTLRAHPDLGGDPDAAARINAAYAVLTDPARRLVYDRLMRRPLGKAAPQPVPPAADQGPAAAAPPSPVKPPLAASDPAAWLADRACPFCQRRLPASVHLDTRCSHCDSPLFRRPDVDRGELFGRRRSPRNARPTPATLRLPGLPGDHVARLRDLSLSGLCVLSTVQAPERSALRVMTGSFDAVAVVVGCRPQGTHWLLHAELLTLQLLRSQGVFVSAKV
jgi:curved DNA-binding protein CbpA